MNVRIIGVYDDGTGFVAATEHPVPFWRETFSQPLEAFEQKKGILVKLPIEKKLQYASIIDIMQDEAADKNINSSKIGWWKTQLQCEGLLA